MSQFEPGTPVVFGAASRIIPNMFGGPPERIIDRSFVGRAYVVLAQHGDSYVIVRQVIPKWEIVSDRDLLKDYKLRPHMVALAEYPCEEMDAAALLALTGYTLADCALLAHGAGSESHA